MHPVNHDGKSSGEGELRLTVRNSHLEFSVAAQHALRVIIVLAISSNTVE